MFKILEQLPYLVMFEHLPILFVKHYFARQLVFKILEHLLYLVMLEHLPILFVKALLAGS